MTELAVEVRGLRKRYGELTAVDGLDLGIRRGEVFGILGPNGAGRSTTVEILRGHRSRAEGTAAVLGVDPARADRRWRSPVGIVWQDESAPAGLTVRETVAHFARYCPGRATARTSSRWWVWSRRPAPASRSSPAAGGAVSTWRSA